MKHRGLIIPLISLLLLLSYSCNSSDKGPEKNTITVSILPFKYFTEKIAGDKYSINVIVPPGASPATFEPPPSVIKSLRLSEALIFNRYLGFEQAWMDKLMEVNPDINTLYLADNQDLIASEKHKHGDHYHFSGVDPHFWVSVSSAKIIAEDIYKFLSKVYQGDKDIFEKNYADLLLEIDETNKYITATLEGLENRNFLIFHPALSYFAVEFGLVQIPIELEGKEPTASWLKAVIDLSREKDINTILVQQEFNKKSAEIIADEIDASVVNIFPLSDNWTEALRDIADAIAVK